MKVKSDEEKCPKTLPLALTRALKAPVESEYGRRREQIRKRKRVEERQIFETKPQIMFLMRGITMERGACLRQMKSS